MEDHDYMLPRSILGADRDVVLVSSRDRGSKAVRELGR